MLSIPGMPKKPPPALASITLTLATLRDQSLAQAEETEQGRKLWADVAAAIERARTEIALLVS